MPCTSGQIARYPNNGQVITRSYFLDVMYGVSDRFDVQVQLPYFNLSFQDDTWPNRPVNNSLGDIRFSGRYNLYSEKWVETLRIEVKSPTGFFNQDSDIIPVGDGQWDIMIQNQNGLSLYPAPAFLNLELGYRFRLKPSPNVSTLQPGDELVYAFEGGYNLFDDFWLKGRVHGWYGGEWNERDMDGRFVEIPFLARRVIYLEPGIYWELWNKQWAVELSVQHSIWGQNMPYGQVFGFALTYIHQQSK